MSKTIPSFEEEVRAVLGSVGEEYLDPTTVSDIVIAHQADLEAARRENDTTKRQALLEAVDKFVPHGGDEGLCGLYFDKKKCDCVVSDLKQAIAEIYKTDPTA